MSKQLPAPSMGLDFSEGPSRSGYRLDRMELYNWGTFDGKVHVLRPNGYNMLVTGDKGSGKSTIADALQAILCQPRASAFNQASGGEANDRSLRSYFDGYYRSERHQDGGGKPVALRDGKHYSVILASFHNDGFDETVTLAIVFFPKENQIQPGRFYVGAECNLTIAEHFSEFGGDLNALRKRLRSQGCQIEDSFTEHSAWFRGHLGIKSPQAMELFHQTVSMKEVPDLTDFVRHHMLEPFEVEALKVGLISHYDTLTRSHDAILRAKQQRSMLDPLVAEADRYDAAAAERDEKVALREAITPAFNGIRLELLDERLRAIALERDAVELTLQGKQAERESCALAIRALQEARIANGGGRIESLTAEIGRLESMKSERKTRWNSYFKRLEQLAIEPAVSPGEFAAQRRELATRREALEENLTRLEEDILKESTAFQRLQEKHAALEADIRSLKGRTSNIDSAQIRVREALCSALGLKAADIPFAGELLQVRDEEIDWEGAVERLLGGFGTALLISDEHYAQASDWIDAHRLGVHIVYYHLKPRTKQASRSLHPHSLVRKLEVKPGAFASWLEAELAQRFDYACCETMEEFRREAYAITKAGQIKHPSGRHEKDDRYDIDDRSQYVLGWSNEAKIAALAQQAAGVTNSAVAAGTEVARLQKARNAARDTQKLLEQLTPFESFEDLDWQSTARRIAALLEERARLEGSSDALKQISTELEKAEQTQGALDQEIGRLRDQRAIKLNDLDRLTGARLELEKAVGEEQAPPETLSALKALREAVIGPQALTYANCMDQAQTIRKALQADIDAITRRLSTLQERIVQKMGAFKNAFPVETSEMDARTEASGEYRAYLARLVADDLPRFEKRFKDDLNENTINEIVNFSAQLERAQSAIKKRIDLINRSMAQIDYSPGRYLVLLAEPGLDKEVKDFRSELKACTEGALTGSEEDQYSEAKFLQVKRLIDRFKGRLEHTEEDERWTNKVTDVRNWFQFAAVERWRADNSDYEYYESSGGKSGGQKEMLAYTVLAAALAYQFGLEFGERSSRAFRFVLIDEAFSRGTEESANHCLSLLEKLGLQVIVVTPLQKIAAIEPHVARVGFVHIVENKRSYVRNLTLDEYQAEKSKAQAA